MDATFARVRSVFEAALEVPPAERDALLARECGGDAALRREVAQLLAHDASTTPAAEALEGTAARWHRSHDPWLDAEVGGFRLRAVLGGGGMGTVYRAEQAAPRREVALKVMSLGLGSPAAVARFRFEAELLGRLRHPAIAQVHAAGVHLAGEVELPWFALELVEDARDLVSWADAHGLALRERLALWLQVADAVHHGHLQGIVHRDLKPQNVLVDVEGRVKVIDFGIARSTARGDGEAPALATERGIVHGTLAYMSPEQLAGDVVDHRTDVWALAVLGFELLTGRRPFAIDGELPWRVAEIVQTTPPARLSSLLPSAPRDLDAVFAMALRQPVAARYESAAAFAADVRAVLADRPVAARPASALYHLRLFARRRRGVVAALLAVAATIVVALVVLGVKNVELDRKNVELDHKERQSSRIAKFARDFLIEADVARDRGVAYTVREALDEGARALEREQFPDPLVEADLRALLGEAYRGLSLPTEAIAQLEKAAAIRRARLGDDDRLTMTVDIALAACRAEGDDVDRAVRDLDDVARRSVQVLGADDPDTLRAQHEQARAWRTAGRLRDAETAYRALIAARERVLGRTAAPTIATLHNLGTLLLATRRAAEARPVLEDALARSRAAGEVRTSTWMIADNLGEALREEGRFPEAADVHRSAMQGFAERLGPDHELTIGAGYHLLKVLHYSGDKDAMRALAIDLLARCERTFGVDHPRTMDVLAAVALARQQAGDLAGAVADMSRAFANQRKRRGAQHPDTFLAGQNLASTQLAAGDATGALATTSTMIADLATAADVAPVGIGYTHLLHARALQASGDVARAAAEAATARDLLQDALPAQHSIRQQAEQLAAELAAARGGG